MMRRPFFTGIALVLAANTIAAQEQAAAPVVENPPVASTNELSQELLGKLQTAAQHVKANQPREAIALYTEFLAARADVFSPYVDRGKLYFAEKEYAKALEDYSAALKLKPDLHEAYLQRCMAYYELGEFAKAIADCDKFVRSTQRMLTHEPFYYTGMSHARLKEHAKAWEWLSKAFEIRNELPDAHMFLGEMYADQQQLLSALREFSIVVQQRPGDKEALKRRGAIKALLGDEAGSREDFAKAQ